MNIHIQRTSTDEYGNMIDINYQLLENYRRPLIIGTRDGQLVRILKWLQSDTKPDTGTVTLMGWWDLKEEDYVRSDGLVPNAWTQHDAVIFLDPERCAVPKYYDRLMIEAELL